MVLGSVRCLSDRIIYPVLNVVVPLSDDGSQVIDDATARLHFAVLHRDIAATLDACVTTSMRSVVQRSAKKTPRLSGTLDITSFLIWSRRQGARHGRHAPSPQLRL
jgi:hypothetical protein